MSGAAPSGRAGRAGRGGRTAGGGGRTAGNGDPLLLGIDLGTSAVKVVVATTTGSVLGRGTVEYPIDRPAPDRAEQDPERWWTAVAEATRGALRGADTGRVAAIGLSGQMHGTVLLSAAHRPIAPAIIWPDQRGGRQVEALTRELGRERVVELIGGPFATGFQAVTLRWLREKEPRLLDRAVLVLAPKDALRLRMTGVVASEPSDGSGTALLDPHSRTWSSPVLDAVGLGAERLPPLGEAAAIAGTLLPAAADALGLPPGIPVVAGGADTPVGLLGAGVATADAFLLTISTGGQLAVPSTTVEIDPTGRSHTFCSVLAPGGGAAGWYRMAAMLSAGLALRWLRDSVLALEGPDAYDQMLGWAADVPPGARGLIFLPYLAGERSPHMDPSARGVLLGLTAGHGRPEIVRAVVEGITLGCFDASRALAEAGALPASIVLAGGGAQSRTWQGIVADVFGLPVRRLETVEQAALGACLLAAGGVGLLDPAAASRAWARLGPTIQPDLARHAQYRDVYELFRAEYPKLRDDFGRLAALPIAT